MTRNSKTLSALPQTLQEIRGVVGFEAMVCLTVARGGERIWIPGYVKADHWLIETIGVQSAEKLSRHFAIQGNKALRGISITLPVLPKELAVRHLTKEGKSISQIVRKLLISSRSVSRYRKQLREAGLL